MDTRDLNLERLQILTVAKELVDANRERFTFRELTYQDLLDEMWRLQVHEDVMKWTDTVIDAIYWILCAMEHDGEIDTGWWMRWGNLFDHILFIMERHYIQGEPKAPFHFLMPGEQERCFKRVRSIYAAHFHAESAK